MKFVLELDAPTLCRAKTIARRKVAEWSMVNNTTIFMKSISAGTLPNGKKKVTIVAEGSQEEQIFLS